MRNLGLAFLALVALFVGGCSLLIFGEFAWNCGIGQNNESCFYAGIGSFLAVGPFILSIGLGRLMWNIHKGNRKWGTIEYLLLVMLILYIVAFIFFPPRGM
jgi:hypothetical protein